MDSDFAAETIEPYMCQAGELVTAKSFLVDRFVPACEVIELPPHSVPGGRLQLRISDGVCEPPRSSRRKATSRGWIRALDRRPLEVQGCAIDFRVHNPWNWAHSLNNHLPLLLHILDRLGDELQDLPTVILPAGIPVNIKSVFGKLGFSIAETNQAVKAVHIEFEMSPWAGVRAIRHKWVTRAAGAESALSALIGSERPPFDKVFISRRNTRCLTNEAEVEQFLSARGYRKIYPEQHSIEEQFGFLSVAHEIVAVHGAALAPLLYRPPGSGPIQLVELMPVGHMTNVYRVMTQQVGGDWIGVRGKISPQHVRHAYDFSRPFTRFSLDNFEVDLESLEIALERVQYRR